MTNNKTTKVQACLILPIIQATWKVEIRQSWFKANSGKKLARSQRTSWVLWYITVIPATWQSEVGGSQFEASPEQKHKSPCEKQTETKRAKGCDSSGKVLA
jgi:hypothetical protein